MAVLLGLLPSYFRVLRGFLGLDNSQRFAVFPEKNIVAELAGAVNSGFFSKQGLGMLRNEKFLDDLGSVRDIPPASLSRRSMISFLVADSDCISNCSVGIYRQNP